MVRKAPISTRVTVSLTNKTGAALGGKRCRGVSNHVGEFRPPYIIGLFLTISADYARRERRQGVDIGYDIFDVTGGEGADDSLDVSQCLCDAEGVRRGTVTPQRISATKLETNRQVDILL
jgi:hypothetical protein